jgi:V/A-type H+-transporting ATPase subunit D
VARLALSKSSLSRERTRLRSFQRFLPSLDLKRRQLMGERGKATQALAETERELKRVLETIGARVPMLANDEVELDGLVQVKRVDHDIENLVGVKLPRLNAVEVEVQDYALLGRPQWVDVVADQLRICLELKIRIQIERRRVERLNLAVRRITQRVNLFEKVLIPSTRKNIQRIQIYLSDADRASVVQAKIAKRKRAAEASA